MKKSLLIAAVSSGITVFLMNGWARFNHVEPRPNAVLPNAHVDDDVERQATSVSKIALPPAPARLEAISPGPKPMAFPPQATDDLGKEFLKVLRKQYGESSKPYYKMLTPMLAAECIARDNKYVVAGSAGDAIGQYLDSSRAAEVSDCHQSLISAGSLPADYLQKPITQESTPWGPCRSMAL